MLAQLRRLLCKRTKPNVWTQFIGKSHNVSIRMKSLYVFGSVSPVTERMVWLCASVSHYTIPQCYSNALLIWISQLPLNVSLFPHVDSGILASAVSSFLAVVNYYLASVCVHFLHSAAVDYGNNSATCGAMAASRAQHRASFAAAIQRVSLPSPLRTTVSTRSHHEQNVFQLLRCRSHSCWIILHSSNPTSERPIGPQAR